MVEEKDLIEVYKFMMNLTDENKIIFKRYAEDKGITSLNVYGYSIEDVMKKKSCTFCEALMYIDALQKIPFHQIEDLIK